MNSRNRTYEEAFPELPILQNPSSPRMQPISKNRQDRLLRPISRQCCGAEAQRRIDQLLASARSRHGRSTRSLSARPRARKERTAATSRGPRSQDWRPRETRLIQSKQPNQMKTDPAHVHTRLATSHCRMGLQMKSAIWNKLRPSWCSHCPVWKNLS